MLPTHSFISRKTLRNFWLQIKRLLNFSTTGGKSRYYRTFLPKEKLCFQTNNSSIKFSLKHPPIRSVTVRLSAGNRAFTRFSLQNTELKKIVQKNNRAITEILFENAKFIKLFQKNQINNLY